MVDLYRSTGRLVAKLFSLGCSGAFHSFGRHTVIQPPIRLGGEARIAIGDDVFIGPRCWLQVLPDPTASADSVALRIGSGTSVVGDCVFSAAASITIGERVLFARGVYVLRPFAPLRGRGVGASSTRESTACSRFGSRTGHGSVSMSSSARV